MGTRLARLVTRPILILMITLTILVIGGIALLKLPIQAFPNGFAGSRINLWIPVREQNPKEVEEKIYAPLEGQLLTIPGVESVRGWCSSRGVRVFIELNPGFDPRLGVAEVRDRIQRARPSWPAEIDRWWSWRESSTTIPLMFFGIGLPDTRQKTFDAIDNVLRPKLEAIDGVGEVTFFGQVVQSVRILFQRKKVQQHRLNLFELIQKLRGDNLRIPIGTVPEGDSRFIVTADLRYGSIKSIEDIPIGQGLKLSDIAEIKKVRSLSNSISRVNGKIAIHGLMRKTSDANAVDTAKRIRETFDHLVKTDSRLKGLVPIWFFDQGLFIQESIDNLVGSAFLGGIFAFFVLLMFLRRLKMTLAITLSLPLSLLVASSVLFFRGETFNMISMASLTIALGMLVDNSIVVLENIYRLRQKGLPWTRACQQGVSEVSTAVFLATLTSIVVFLPMFFMGDSQGSRVLLSAFGIPLSTALLASLFVALILLPAATRVLHRRETGGGPQPRQSSPTAAPTRTGFARLSLLPLLGRIQGRILRFSLDHRILASLAATLLLGLFFAMMKMNARTDVTSQGNRGQVSINWELPRGYTLSEADEVCLRLEKILLGRKTDWHLKYITARVNRKTSQINLTFYKGTTSKQVEAITEKIKKDLPEIPGIETTVSSQVAGRGEQAREGEHGFMIRIDGRDSDFLQSWAKKIKKGLLANKLASDVDLGQSEGQDEILMRIDRSRMQELGVESQILNWIVGAGLRGQEVSRIQRPDGSELRLIAEYDDSADLELKDLKAMRIFARGRGSPRLSQLAAFELSKGYGSIVRENGRLSLRIAGSRPKNLSWDQFQRGLFFLMKTWPVPRGYSWSIGGKARKQGAQMAEMASALMLGLLLVFLVMGVLFESVILPFAIYAALPLALIGGLAFFYTLGGMLDVPAYLGLIVLVGVLVNNGIVLLDHIIRLQSQGLDRRSAILQGTRDRLRPILMTAGTTIVGLIPMIFQDQGSSQGFSYQGLASVVALGLFLGTLLTPTVVPLAYSILDDAWTFVKNLFRTAAMGRAGKPRPEQKEAAPSPEV
jgi:HAE1 family hydrophobic/amphiphilic exporter-1